MKCTLFRILYQELSAKPVKYLLIISSIVLFIFVTAYTEVKTLNCMKTIQKDKQTNSQLVKKYLFFLIICSITQSAKLFVFFFLFGDIIESLVRKSFHYILFTRWDKQNQIRNTSENSKREIFEEKAQKNGCFQIFMKRGVKGLTKMCSIIICTILPRIASFCFLVSNGSKNSDDSMVLKVLLFQAIAVVIAGVVAQFIIFKVRKRMVNAEADVSRSAANCIEQDELVFYSNMSEKEFKKSEENIKNFRKNMIFGKMIDILLTLSIYMLCNCCFIYILYYFDSHYTTFPYSALIDFMSLTGFVEKQTTFTATTLLKLRKAAADSVFAYEFVQKIESFDKSTKVQLSNADFDDEEQFYEESDENGKENIQNTQISQLNKPARYRNKPIIEFNSFSVTIDGRYLFDSINLEIFKNQKILIRGRNGIGKSSMLLALFHHVEYEGKILIEDKNAKKFSNNDILDRFSICPQKTALMDISIRENLTYGNCATENEINEICSRLKINQMISEMSDQLETKIKPCLKNISIGEAKKITIARTLLRKKEIYWFDEPTSGLDPQSEKLIINIITKLPATVICILHSEQFDSYFDQIIHLNRSCF